MTDGVTASTARASGRLMKKTQGHDAYSVSTPPRNTPALIRTVPPP
jgi:hypothetical protein